MEGLDGATAIAWVSACSPASLVPDGEKVWPPSVERRKARNAPAGQAGEVAASPVVSRTLLVAPARLAASMPRIARGRASIRAKDGAAALALAVRQTPDSAGLKSSSAVHSRWSGLPGSRMASPISVPPFAPTGTARREKRGSGASAFCGRERREGGGGGREP